MNTDDLTINIDDLDFGDLLSDWASLLSGNYGPLLMNAFGDLFLQGENGHVYFLDLASGTANEVAKDLEEFSELLNEENHVAQWFMPGLVEELHQQNMLLDPGQCYGYKIPPILSGPFIPENIQPTDISLHYASLAHVYEQVKDVPAGTNIGNIKIA